MEANVSEAEALPEERQADAAQTFTDAQGVPVPTDGTDSTDGAVVDEEADTVDTQHDAEATGETAEAEDDEELNAADESTALLIRVAEMEALARLQKGRHRRDLWQKSAQVRCLTREKQLYTTLITSLKDEQTHAEQAKPSPRGALEAVHAEMAHNPQLAALLLRLSSFIYRTEGVQTQIATSKQWNQQLNHEKQLAQHSRLRALDELLSQPAQAIVAQSTAEAGALGPSEPRDGLPSASVSAAAAEALQLSRTSLQSTRAALSQLPDAESTARLQPLLDVWAKLTTDGEDRVAALARLSAAAGDVERTVRTALMRAPLWDLLESQEALHSSTSSATSSLAAREDDLLKQNTELRQHKASLELALATATAAASASLSRPDDRVGTAHGEEALQKQLRLVRASVAAKQERRETLARELVTLRRAVRCEAVDGASACETSPSVSTETRLAQPDAVLQRALLTRVTEQVARTVQQWAAAGGSGAPSEADSADDVLARVASQQQTLNALIADNAALWQQIQDIRLAEVVATEPEKAANLAQAVLLQCGAAEDARDDGPGEPQTSARQMEHSLLARFDAGVAAVSQRVTESLAELEGGCLSSWRQLLQDTDTLMRLVHVRLHGEAAAPDSDTESVASTNAALAQLRETLHRSGERPSVLTVVPRTADAVPIPSISLQKAQETRQRLAALSEAAQATVQNCWSKLEEESSTMVETLQWYAQHPLDGVEAELAAARAHSDALQRQSTNLKMALSGKQQALRDADGLRAQLETLRTTAVPTARQSLVEAEREVALLEARAPLWQMIRDEQQNRHDGIAVEEAAELQRIRDVFLRVRAALSAVAEPEPDTTAPAEATVYVKPEEAIKTEEAAEEEEESQVPQLEEPAKVASEAQLTPPTAEAMPVVKEEAVDDEGQEGELDAPTDALMKEDPTEVKAEAAEEEEAYHNDDGAELPALAPDEAVEEEAVEEAQAANEEGQEPIAEEEQQPISEHSPERADADETQLPLAEEPTSPAVPEDYAAEDDEEVPADDTAAEVAVNAVKQEEDQGADDPFFSGFGFEDE